MSKGRGWEPYPQPILSCGLLDERRPADRFELSSDLLGWRLKTFPFE
jgi:hypothetical protein